jgi:arsenite-transporting ATPase
VIVVDMAPTGHALRLLETPSVARDWVDVLMRLLLKYRSVVPPGELASELVALSKSIRTLNAWIRDSRQTRVVVVTRAARVPRLETVRLVGQLGRLHLRVAAVVINALTLRAGRCPLCRATAARERAELGASDFGPACAIIQTPLVAPPPRAVRPLETWARAWIA